MTRKIEAETLKRNSSLLAYNLAGEACGVCVGHGMRIVGD
jgi:hypothetical protein